VSKTIYKGSEFDDVEYQEVEDDKIVTKILSVNEQARLLRQIDKEYDVCFGDTEAKRASWLLRLKLYNNQNRDQDLVGEPLIFTIFNTIHAALWDDRLMVNWEGRGGQGDEDVEDNLNALSVFDYDIIQKAELDYDWNWDAEFFGRGLMLEMDFNREEGKKCPSPEVIDPTTWIRDPKAKSVNGDMEGRGAMRFGGYEIGLSYWEMKDNPAYFNLGSIKKGKDYNSLKNKAADERATAQGRTRFDTKEEALDKSGNYEFILLRWFTTFKGKKIMVELGNQRSLVVRIYKLGDLWPIIDRALYPIAHDWDGVSIPDLTEDKQRFKAVLLNLAGKSAKADVLPNYLYDASRITNRKDLNFKFNKFIPVQGRVDNAIVPFQKSTMHQYVNVIMDILDQAAQKATATPEIQQGIQSKEQRTLGELQLVASKVDTRYSMSAKLYGLSEAKFWRQWYWLYKKHFKEGIDEKIIRIQGVFSPIWRPLTRENIIAQVDPDVKIESKIISEAKRERDRQSYSAFAGLALQDPTNNRRFIQKKLAKLHGFTKEEIDMTFPPTVDELQAEEENILINNDKAPDISIRDDHQTHLAIHAKANLNAALMAHIIRHRKLMVEKRNMPEVFPPAGEPQFNQPGQQTQQPPRQPQPTTPTM
jgi:hypothetical protein